MRKGFDPESVAIDLIGRGNEGREEIVVYGYVNENEGDLGRRGQSRSRTYG